MPVDAEGNTWLVGQFRYTLNAFHWEIPEGGSPSHEEAEFSARRELQEETGLTAKKWTELTQIHTSNSVTDEVGYIFLAEDLTQGFFAKLLELFDDQGVSFVSVTQQFNTTTSMGRLTLNVLLSFAQFEREVTSERIRDKIAASKRKGLWVGGPLPLGYEMKDGKIAVVEDEAERVRLIYRRYLELSGVNALVRDLRDKEIRTKTRLRATGVTHGGIPFRTRLSILSVAQPVLYWRGQIQGRDPARRAASDHGKGTF